jgi:hypothetical protein
MTADVPAAGRGGVSADVVGDARQSRIGEGARVRMGIQRRYRHRVPAREARQPRHVDPLQRGDAEF